MASIEEKIREIREELDRTKYNKATEHHIGILKAKLAHLQAEAEKHRKGGGIGFSLPKSGDATVVLLGFPNVGKSSLLNRLTGARSSTGDFSFTTLRVIPGMLFHRGARIQLLDLPGIIENASGGHGRGREVLSVVRAADLVAFVVDPGNASVDRILAELDASGIVVNRRRNRVTIRRTTSGGIRIYSARGASYDRQAILEVMKEFRISNAEVYLRNGNTLEDLIFSLRKNITHMRGIVVVNKSDLISSREKIFASLPPDIPAIFVSAVTGEGLSELKEAVFRELHLIRVFLRDRAGNVDYDRPMILREGATVRQVCRKISREMIQSFRYATVSSPASRVENKRVGIDYHVADGDIINIVTR